MYSNLFKLWHWLNATVLSLIIGTVIARDLFFDKNDNAKILVSKLDSLSVSITNEEAILVANAIRSPFWKWHIMLGYILGGLLIYRLLLIFDKKTIAEKPQDLHMKLVKIGYKVFYFILFVLVITGLMIVFRQNIGFSKDVIHYVKELHQAFYVGLLFIPLHIIAVLIKNKTDKTLVNKML